MANNLLFSAPRYFNASEIYNFLLKDNDWRTWLWKLVQGPLLGWIFLFVMFLIVLTIVAASIHLVAYIFAFFKRWLALIFCLRLWYYRDSEARSLLVSTGGSTSPPSHATHR